MQKVLEVLGGKRYMLVCEKIPTKAGVTMATLKGPDVEIKTSCNVMLPRDCFTKSNVLYLLLPADFDTKLLKDVEEVEILAIA